MLNIEYYFTHETGYDKLLSSKLRSDGTIIIHKIQEVFTKEDLFIAFKYLNGEPERNSENLQKDFETWFENNY